MTGRVVEIDGSMGEGGGQILRYSLALSALLLRPLRIYNIRAKRSNPGLRPQHLTAVRALAEITGARVEGARVGSMELYFEPRRRRGGRYRFNIGTAGSVTLVIQAILPVLLYSDRDSVVEITGGTDVQWSPSIDYMRYVFLHNIGLMGPRVEIELLRRGHYPRGGGRVVLRVHRMAAAPRPVSLRLCGGLRGIRVISHAVRLPSHVAVRQAEAAKRLLLRELGVEPEVVLEYYERGRDPHLGPGSGILVYGSCSGGSVVGADALGARGKPAEVVGEEAASKFVEEARSNRAFDRHMGDMLVPYMSLGDGESYIGVSRVTSHLVTALSVTKMFLPEMEYVVEGGLGYPGFVRVRGVGYSP